MSGEAIEIEYQLTVDDYAKFSADWHSTPKIRKQYLKLFLLSCVYCVCIIEYIFYMGFRSQVREGKLRDSDFYTFHFNQWFSANSIVLFLIIIFVYFFCYSKNRIHRRNYKWVKNVDRSGENKAILSPLKIILSRAKVNLSSSYVNSDYQWDGFENVQILGGDLCLFISVRSALIIPSRFFKSEEEKQRIYQQCLKWWEAAREKPVAAEGVV